VRHSFVASVLILASTTVPPRQASETFGWFHSWTEFDAGDLRDLQRREIAAKTLSAGDSQIAVCLAGAIDTEPDRFVDAARHPEALWKSTRIPRVGRWWSSGYGDINNATTQVVHVAIARRESRDAIAPEVLIVSRQIFASHYVNGSLAVSMLIHDRTESRR
jgi:hypothetical protein